VVWLSMAFQPAESFSSIFAYSNQLAKLHSIGFSSFRVETGKRLSVRFSSHYHFWKSPQMPRNKRKSFVGSKYNYKSSAQKMISSPVCTKVEKYEREKSAMPVDQLYSLITPKQHSTCAFAFDVDGVLYRGSKRIGNSNHAIKLLQQQGIPFIYLTNSGGTTEENKAVQLSKKLGVNVHPSQVQMSHTPLQFLSKKYQNDLVLVVGKTNAREIAERYNFRNIVTVEEYHAQHPELFPDDKPPKVERIEKYHEPVKACVVLTAPSHWYRDMQILCDVLRSDGRSKHIVSEQVVPCYLAGPDLEYVAEAETPRLGDGAFLKCLEHIYLLTSGHHLKTTVLGKPHPNTYRCAERLLEQQAAKLGYDGIHTIYGIGDNPMTDIKGANAAGSHWVSTLVHTGMFQPSEEHTNCQENPASLVASNVHEAVQRILEIEKEKSKIGLGQNGADLQVDRQESKRFASPYL